MYPDKELSLFSNFENLYEAVFAQNKVTHQQTAYLGAVADESNQG